MFTDTINTSDIILPPWGLINGEKGCQVQSKLAGEFFQTTQADSVNCATQEADIGTSYPPIPKTPFFPSTPQKWVCSQKYILISHLPRDYAFNSIFR